jgi:SAM-dependent methyltransferase
MQGVPRLSVSDETWLGGYAESRVRLAFAAKYCRDRRVLDAGCGVGFGADYLLRQGAASVLGIDLSADAIHEAQAVFGRGNARFRTGDLQRLREAADADGPFEVIVCFETLAHLADPAAFLQDAHALLGPGGVFILSTPHREAVPHDASGKPYYPFSYTSYTVQGLDELVAVRFPQRRVLGQWLTPTGMLRKRRAETAFQYLCEGYYHPAARIYRRLRGLLGKPVLPPPEGTVQSDSYDGDYELAPIDLPPVPWPPTILVAVGTRT